jgi:thiamine-phosphate pyrophosphorylase
MSWLIREEKTEITENENIVSVKEIAKLHYLTQDNVPGFTHAQLAEEACKGGVKWVQLRVKNTAFEDWLKIAKEVKAVTDAFSAKLIINDNVEIAAKIGAAGVHLGKEDMHPIDARKILGTNAIIGGTANNEADLLKLIESNSVDYIGLGPYRFTVTKEKLSPVLHADELKRLIGLQSRIPVIVIGGINSEDVENILGLGAYGVAVSSAINLAGSREKATTEFLRIIKVGKL